MVKFHMEIQVKFDLNEKMFPGILLPGSGCLIMFSDISPTIDGTNVIRHPILTPLQPS